MAVADEQGAKPMLTWLSATDSTRSVALSRIGLALVTWTRFGNTWVLFRNMEHLVLSLLGFAVTAAMLVGCTVGSRAP